MGAGGRRSKAWQDLLFGGALLAVAVGEVVLLHASSPVLTALMAATGAVALLYWRGRSTVALFVTAAVLGTVGEIVCSHAGVWQYREPDLLGVPVWLPFGWGVVAVQIRGIAESIARLWG